MILLDLLSHGVWGDTSPEPILAPPQVRRRRIQKRAALPTLFPRRRLGRGTVFHNHMILLIYIGDQAFSEKRATVH